MAGETILIADDDQGIRTVLQGALAREGFDVRVTSNASTLWNWISAGDGQLVITDVVLPDESGLDLIPKIKKIRPNLQVIVLSAQNTVLTALRASQRGAFDYLPKPFDLVELTNIVKKALSFDNSNYTNKKDIEEEELPLIGRSPAMQEVYRVVARLINTDLTILINGESGTGKELVARCLHEYGKRKNFPFIAVNVAAIPKELIESELFGHEKGSFTGATSRKSGRFEQAEGGTLFLDEIGDMPQEAQTRLLRVLQEGEYLSVGGATPIKTNVRVVAATHRDLPLMIKTGEFREDLYYRLNVVPIRIPPLRERVSDIPELVQHFLSNCSKDGLTTKIIDKLALERLQKYDWPGNVRELENLIYRLVVLYSENEIGIEIVDSELVQSPKIEAPVDLDGIVFEDVAEHYIKKHFEALKDEPSINGLYNTIIKTIEKPLITSCLEVTKGNQIKAAEILGINRNTLRKKLKELNITISRGVK